MTGMIPVINVNQSTLNYKISITKPGPYIILINYITPEDDQRTHKVDVDIVTDTVRTSQVVLYSCVYNNYCRQVITSNNNSVSVFQVDGNDLEIKIRVSENIFSVLLIFDDFLLIYNR